MWQHASDTSIVQEQLMIRGFAFVRHNSNFAMDHEVWRGEDAPPAHLPHGSYFGQLKYMQIFVVVDDDDVNYLPSLRNSYRVLVGSFILIFMPMERFVPSFGSIGANVVV